MDTIVAAATPSGRSAIAVVRLSGPTALDIARLLVHDDSFSPRPNQVILKDLKTDDGAVMDQALVTFFKAPHSFTGEDMVEISCHGSPVVVRRLLDRIQQLDGRLAGPGEFTLRACRNGKMNLSQAEAIRDLIDARTAAAAQLATRQLKGELSNALSECKQYLIDVIVKLESALEFVEDDLPELQRMAVIDELAAVRSTVDQLAKSYESGHLVRDGLNVAFVGRPNVGKSSLFNKLLTRDRAIVTELPGTTRDSLTETIALNGIPVTLTDTAGIREAGDRIEAIGVERTHRAMADADLLVVVLDGSTEIQAEDRRVLERARAARHVVAVNKSDLVLRADPEEMLDGSKVVHVSAVTGGGLTDLSAAILEPFGSVDAESVGLLVTDSRHCDLLLRATAALEESASLMRDGASEELVLVGLHNALRYLGEITGETTTDEILGRIFSTFCIGK
ncbi:MAG TPA: tRNA uridine-5-carboxymethylaminomethyl(34) synthesis GTPase MnmE [Pyrinomonadaceae bacterium]|nr:tRNA uridine-5-carboxymethylaminomethyl(34) synthesis GTPase MnmE [Pyrinomonadaceae bacterium]